MSESVFIIIINIIIIIIVVVVVVKLFNVLYLFLWGGTVISITECHHNQYTI